MPGDWKKRSLEDQEAELEAAPLRLKLAVYLDRSSVLQRNHWSPSVGKARPSVGTCQGWWVAMVTVSFVPKLFRC